MAKITDKLNAASLAASKTGDAMAKTQNAMDLAAGDAERYQRKIEEINASMDSNAEAIARLERAQAKAFSEARQSELEKLIATQDKLGNSLLSTDRALTKANMTYDENKNKLATLNTQYDVQSDKVRRLQAEYDELSDSLGGSGPPTDDFNKKLDETGGVAERTGGRISSLVNTLSGWVSKISGFVNATREANREFYNMESATENASDELEKTVGILSRLGNALNSVKGKAKEIKNPFSGWLSKAAGVYSTLRLINRLGRMIGNTFNAVMDATGKWAASTDGTATVMNKFNQSIEATQKSIGEKLLPLAAIGADLVAQAFDWIGQKVNEGINWVLENIDKVIMALTIVGSGIILLAAIWIMHWAIMNLPLILIIGVIAAWASKMVESGVTVTDVLEKVGSAFGALYGVVYNVFAWIWNYVIAPFAEFLSEVFEDPLGAIVRMFAKMADGVLSIIELIASKIDAAFGTNLAAAVSGWRGKLEASVEEKFGVTIDPIRRMEYKDIGDTMAEFSDKFASIGDTLGGIGDKLDKFDLSQYATPDKSIKTKGEVKIDGEDIKMLLDISALRYQQTFQTLAPQVDLGGVVINENADVDYFVNTLVDRIEEASGSRLD